MEPVDKLLASTMSRRDSLKLSGLALGGLSLPSVLRGASPLAPDPCASYTECGGFDWWNQAYTWWDKDVQTQDYTHGYPRLEDNEMRITFLGSTIPPARIAQALMSVFVEVGGGPNGKAADQVVFDLGTGSTTNYNAMGISPGRMDKLFISHLHFDHMGDLPNLYCAGAAGDRKSPQFVFGQSPSGVFTPRPDRRRYADGVITFCKALREMCRWNTEAFSFLPTSYLDGVFDFPVKERWGLPYEPEQVGDDHPTDGYALYPVELPWARTDVAYHNPSTRLKVTHFPVVHDRKGAMGFKVDWNGLRMVYTSDTKPEVNSIVQGSHGGKGVDLFVHEMAPPADVWTMMTMRKASADWKDPGFVAAFNTNKTIEQSSHTPPGAFGYLLSQIYPRPRLTVATHFTVSDQLIQCALQSVSRHCPDIGTDVRKLLDYRLLFSMDRMVIRLFAGDPKPAIQVWRPQVLDYSLPCPLQLESTEFKTPRYHDAHGNPDPYAQLDPATVIWPGPDTFCDSGY